LGYVHQAVDVDAAGGRVAGWSQVQRKEGFMSQGARTRRRSGSSVKAGPLYPAVGVNESIRIAGGDQVSSPADCRVHMIGIGGCGMRGAAGVLLRAGAIVSGSDRCGSGALARLGERGADIRIGQCADNLPDSCDVVVYSAAIDASNPELLAARERGLKVIKYAELLGLLMASRCGIAVAGTHGKSTTTAMITFVLREAGLDPSFVIGAGVKQLGGGSGVGDGKHFVVEACEYDRSFLNLQPTFATILNVDEDHLDYYSGLPEIIEAFRAFASRVPAEGVLVVNGEDRDAMRAVQDVGTTVETFGFEGPLDWRAEVLDAPRGCVRFQVLRDGQPLTEVDLSIPGRHNVANALAAMAVCFNANVEPETIARALGEFDGAHRRLTQRGRIAGVTVVDDYAHHPKEIQVTLRAARDFYDPRRLFVVFQPHQHSRTRFLLNDFAMSFGLANVVIVPDIYFVRDSESERDRIDAQDLVERIHLGGGDARYEPSFDRIAAGLCKEVRDGDLVITMGAGNVWQVADNLLDCLAQTRGVSEACVMGDAAEL